jgi:hypothetical protein
MSDAFKATNYTHQDPALLPVDWEARPELHWDEVCRVVGFDPRRNESSYGQLSADWNGHPRGSVILSGLHGEQEWFTIVEAQELTPQSEKPYQIHKRPLHRGQRLVAYELAMADPQTHAIYPASPRVRCRPDQLAECRGLFQQQAKAWAQGQQVPWSPYLRQA